MEFIIGIILSYFLLYITIYLHEFGHAVFYYKYGCKKNAFKVTVKPTLFFSTPAPVDEEKAIALTKREDICVAYGGVLMNLVFVILTFLAILLIKSDNFYVQLLLYQFLTLHLVEIISYMVIGNIYLVSDMDNIAQNDSRLRFPNLLIGIAVTIFYFYILSIIPSAVFTIIIFINVITLLAMGIGRVVFTIKYKHSAS